MTREEIIRMALEAGMSFNQSLEEFNTPFCDGVHCEEFERFAALVAAAEREACAKVCEDEAEKWEGDDGPISTEARLCAINIRARGHA